MGNQIVVTMRGYPVDLIFEPVSRTVRRREWSFTDHGLDALRGRSVSLPRTKITTALDDGEHEIAQMPSCAASLLAPDGCQKLIESILPATKPPDFPNQLTVTN